MLLRIEKRETERRRTSTAASGEVSRFRWRSRTRFRKNTRTDPMSANSHRHTASHLRMARRLAVLVLALVLVPSAFGDPRTVKPDRPAINRLLDEFVPAVVEQKDLKRGWQLVGGVSRVVSYRQWLSGNTSVQSYPAKGTTFHGWVLNYSYPGDVGF